MAKPDWGDPQKRFLSEHAKTGISPRDWYETQGLNYSGIKRYIKVASYGVDSQGGSMERAANLQKVKGPKKAAKAEPEPETIPVIVKHPYATRTPDNLGISDQQTVPAQYIVEDKPRVEVYRLAGHSDVGHGAYTNASRLVRNNKVS